MNNLTRSCGKQRAVNYTNTTMCGVIVDRSVRCVLLLSVHPSLSGATSGRATDPWISWDLPKYIAPVPR